MTPVFLRKELRDALRNRLVLLLIGGLGLVVVLSVVVAAAAFHGKMVDYRAYADAMKSAGMEASINPPQLFPLQLLRGAIEYLEIIGSIVAIVIGYGLAAKEKNRGTVRLLFSRPVSGRSITAGKLLSAAVVWLAVMVVLGIIMFVSLRIAAGSWLSPGESAKLLIALAFSWVYLVIWTGFSFWLADRSTRLSTALVIGLIVWLIVVLILPQIGDTMDADNQVPGGLFKSLQVDKAHEKAVMAHFSGYETIRNFIEEASLSKHFERASFAYLGVKEQYNQQPLGLIARDMWANTAWLFGAGALLLALAFTQYSKRNLLRKA